MEKKKIDWKFYEILIGMINRVTYIYIYIYMGGDPFITGLTLVRVTPLNNSPETLDFNNPIVKLKLLI